MAQVFTTNLVELLGAGISWSKSLTWKKSFRISMFFVFVLENIVVDGSSNPCFTFGNEDIMLVNGVSC